MESRAKLLGHPIQQMLIAFPLGLLASALLFGVGQIASGNEYWPEISFRSIAAEVITAHLAVTGWLGGEFAGRLAVSVDEGAHLDAPSLLRAPRVRG